ncbi:diacylglycerol kinase [Haematobacter missouriensis]|uniref:Diacylglycerol kinase n=1 Tax=Haematobacter missouriensis TaxID=366616 RepID=A0A212AW56_9RHOB|nr:diacylglycerol kinase [Haematobacter missouriensis]OWJ85709.1 diacylglycerol kinase [Haematobacter missouriensis]
MVPPRRQGALHLLDAARYSFAGVVRLWQEAAARLEVTGGALAAFVLALHGATLVQWLSFAGLCCAVLALEALNTALEILCDRISTEWSSEIKQVKDLGSLAVGLGIMTSAGYVALVLLGTA